jgi:hypothetical protein
MVLERIPRVNRTGCIVLEVTRCELESGFQDGTPVGTGIAPMRAQWRICQEQSDLTFVN